MGTLTMMTAPLQMALEDALRHLELPAEWLGPFRERGAHYAQMRRAWRAAVLAYHPDKQPRSEPALGDPSDPARDAERERRTALFTRATAAFEAIDEFYTRAGFAADDEPPGARAPAPPG